MSSLALANQGDLEAFIRANPSPSPELRARWIRSLMDAFNCVHSRKIVAQDIALGNVLVSQQLVETLRRRWVFMVATRHQYGEFSVSLI